MADMNLRMVIVSVLAGRNVGKGLVVSTLADEYVFGAMLLGHNCVLLKTLDNYMEVQTQLDVEHCADAFDPSNKAYKCARKKDAE